MPKTNEVVTTQTPLYRCVRYEGDGGRRAYERKKECDREAVLGEFDREQPREGVYSEFQLVETRNDKGTIVRNTSIEGCVSV